MIRLMDLLLDEAIWGKSGRPKHMPEVVKELYKLHDRIKDSVWRTSFPTRTGAKRIINSIDRLHKGIERVKGKHQLSDTKIGVSLKSAVKSIESSKSENLDSDEGINKALSSTDAALWYLHDALDRATFEIRHGESY